MHDRAETTIFDGENELRGLCRGTEAGNHGVKEVVEGEEVRYSLLGLEDRVQLEADNGDSVKLTWPECAGSS